MDIAGLDVLAHVLRNLAERLPAETARAGFTLPAIVEQLVAKGWTGEKAGQGFYKREGAEILALDPPTMTYRPRQATRIPSL
jgi:3-hydroxyacyl-CoA dehydrogenase